MFTGAFNPGLDFGKGQTGEMKVDVIDALVQSEHGASTAVSVSRRDPVRDPSRWQASSIALKRVLACYTGQTVKSCLPLTGHRTSLLGIVREFRVERRRRSHSATASTRSGVEQA